MILRPGALGRHRYHDETHWRCVKVLMHRRARQREKATLRRAIISGEYDSDRAAG